jgi:hypothetical protein
MLPNEEQLNRIIKISRNVACELEKVVKERAQEEELQPDFATEIRGLIQNLTSLLASDLSKVKTEIPGSVAPSSGGSDAPGSFHQSG